LSKFDINRSFKNWLYTIAVNTAKNTLRKRKVEFVELDYNLTNATTLFSEEISDVEKSVFQEELKEKIITTVNSLPEKYRLVIYLRYVEDLSYDEISEIVKKPLGTVKILIFRAKKLIKNRLGEIK
jgi:RNA polymerase sigma-70 factor (ECF subfamily)